MRRWIHIVATLLTATPVAAACPPTVPANVADAIKDNELRVLCLQQEVTQNADRMKFELQLRSLETQLQQLQLQQRLNVIAQPVIPIGPLGPPALP